MAYICYCIDVNDSTPIRAAHTAAHLAYIETVLDRVLVAGPMKTTGESGYRASVFIYDVQSREEALKLLHDDPYYAAGLYTETDCREFIPAAGQWIGGKTW